MLYNAYTANWPADCGVVYQYKSAPQWYIQWDQELGVWYLIDGNT